ncbi:hypothetical protein D187_009369 [Cystobacter fuscus DSM 2262]|uniref:Uncharacterized protein n=1 Tax=Cystobacter fuscus (strain ATCC 25194 / DSM 2262 / NBRC 100088 / M29) TaxID=1242864 RepID=S9Q246_CYSF2|nr:hypothetical protein D187_009369 [Cystobacter fuscus DSM 2262]
MKTREVTILDPWGAQYGELVLPFHLVRKAFDHVSSNPLS